MISSFFSRYGYRLCLSNCSSSDISRIVTCIPQINKALKGRKQGNSKALNFFVKKFDGLDI